MTRERPIYFSFFMFDSNTRLYDPRLRASYLTHMQVLADSGYAGFELHLGRSYKDRLREALGQGF